jgi:hypothetical protein
MRTYDSPYSLACGGVIGALSAVPLAVASGMGSLLAVLVLGFGTTGVH